MLRIVTGTLLLVALWAAVFPAPYFVFVLVIGIAIVIACWECYGLVELGGEEPFRFLGTAMGLAVLWTFSGYVPAFDTSAPIVLGGGLAFAFAIMMRDGPPKIVQATRGTVLPVLLVALPLSYLVGIRSSVTDGKMMLTLLVVVVALSDSMAFYVGSAIGRRRMAPTISPKKSWEGAIAGVLAATLGAVGFLILTDSAVPPSHGAVLGALLAITGIFGDLAISSLKRTAGAKDTSALLPGHGGLLDRVDSLLFAAPTLYYYHQFVLQGVG
jgi:phosphatidate cytidylyltransferase